MKLFFIPAPDLGATAIGAPVGGGAPGAVLFVDALGDLGQDPGFFDYDKTTHILKRTGDGIVRELRTPGDHQVWSEQLSHATFDEVEAIHTAGFNWGTLRDPRWVGAAWIMEAQPGVGQVTLETYLAVASKDGSKVVRPFNVTTVAVGANDLVTLTEHRTGILVFSAQDGVEHGRISSQDMQMKGGYISETYGASALMQASFAGPNAELVTLKTGVFGDHNRILIAEDSAVTGVEIFNRLVLGNFTAPTIPFIQLSTAVGLVNIMGDTIDPNGVYNARGGSLYIRTDGATSQLYINRSAGAGGTAWSVVTAVP